jgi:hypothetical protein
MLARTLNPVSYHAEQSKVQVRVENTKSLLTLPAYRGTKIN